jgi:bacterioferritin
MNIVHMIDALNKAIALEHAAILQYKQYALLVSGMWRKVFADFFAGESRNAFEHAYKFGQKIAALGGVPTTEVGAMMQPSLDVEEMLRQALALERKGMEAYQEAWKLADDDVALRTMLEDQIKLEQRDIEELEMSLGLVKTDTMAPEGKLQARR